MIADHDILYMAILMGEETPRDRGGSGANTQNLGFLRAGTLSDARAGKVRGAVITVRDGVRGGPNVTGAQTN